MEGGQAHSTAEYRFAYGTVEELLNEDNLSLVGSLEDLNLEEKRGILIEPRFVGVYQVDIPIVSHGEGTTPESLAIYMLGKMSLELFADEIGLPEDKVPSQLIHIGYFSQMPVDILRAVFRDSWGRLRFSEITELPDFSKKELNC
jgi:hypothetical protein